ncbi:efflux RND transporter permease subunit [Nitrospirillum amazonense]|uniref:efflux RND transporter permease subunit n=1 Tax=Nitrospirillum amazonense TaxID=28077 RepID=UPI002DD45059|nr:efflux RND transporter permease subunit [Nitrospirillum amazonense]MEC4592644.1 efflux RND transporter permease subunit [Nitrospirillum amazonense]
MSISEPFIRRPIGTALLAIGLALVGAVAYAFLPVASLPNTDLPIIFIQARESGADPVTMAATVTAPLERHLGEIAGVNEMTSTTSLGVSTIILQFDVSRPVTDAARDVQAAISAAATDLPSGLTSQPTFRKANPNGRPIMTLALTSKTLTNQAIFDAADGILAQRLSQIEGVAQASAAGGEKSAIRVQVDVNALAARKISLADISTAITNANVSQPVGTMDGEDTLMTVTTNDTMLKAQDYRDLVVRTASGTVFRLGDVATVLNSSENIRQAGWFGTQPAVLVSVLKQPGANVIKTVDLIKSNLGQIQKWLPPGIDINVVNDQTGTIRASVDDVQITMLISIGLVILVVGLFLRRLAPTLAAATAVPLSLAGTFAVMWMLDYSMDNLSLMALTISVGFVVDDAIVMIENAVRHREMGKPPLQAALDGAREIGFTIVSMTLSLVAVFMPIIFMGGLAGRLFHEFAMTLTAAILVSGIVSVTLTPMMCARFVDHARERKANWADRWVGRPLDGATNLYMKGLGWVMRHRILMLFVAIGTIFGTIYLYGVVPKGGFPQQDTGLLRGSVRASADTSFQTMQRRMQEVVKIIADDPAVAAIGGTTGGGGGGGPGSSSANTGSMTISLKPRNQRDASADQVIARLRPKFAKMEALQVFLQAEQDLRFGGRSSDSQFQVSLLSDNLDDLYEWGPKLVAKLKELPDYFQDVSSDQDKAGLDAKVVIDRNLASRMNLTPSDVDAALGNAFSQKQVSTLYGARNQYHVVLEATPNEQKGPDDLVRIYVKSVAGMVPLSTFAKVQVQESPLSVNHEGQYPSSTLSFNLAEGVAQVDALARAQQAVTELAMPASMRVEVGGIARIFQQQNQGQPLLILAALVTIYIVLGMLYESWAQPITILSTLPSAGIGAILALMATGFELSMISFIGIILLMGIVKKNAIMLVDFALAAERIQGMSPVDAITEACRERFRPITMTTLTALLGAVPLAVGGGTGAELRQPLGIALVGGLLVSQFITLYTTPVIYLALRPRKVKLSRLHAAMVGVKRS